MIKIAITGNIGSGKSTISNIFKSCGDPIFNADNTVSKIYENNIDFYNAIMRINPDLTINHTVCKKKVIAYLDQNPKFLTTLEKLLYPHLHDAREEFFRICNDKKHNFAICEIPLLFEKNMQHGFDYIILLHCNHNIRWHRVKNRPYMTYDKFKFICNQQVNFETVKKYAHLTIDTNQPQEISAKQILTFRNEILQNSV